MPWKEPGEKPREPRDVWGTGGNDSGGRPDERPQRPRPPGNGGRPGGNTPPNRGFDPEAQWKRLRQRFGRFGGGPFGIIALIVLIIVAWLALGSWTLIDARETGIVLRFGQYQRTLDPGLHLRLPRPITQVWKVDVGRARTVSDELRMLTRDNQIALVDFYVQYKVSDARKFLFATRDSEDAMRDATLAAVRAQIGTQTMQDLMAKTDTALTDHIKQNLQRTLDAYDSGIAVTEVGVQNVSVPQEVKKDYDDIGSAQQDAQRIENDARAAAAKAETDARTQAAREQADANAYKTQRIAQAQGEAVRFNLILAQYKAAPDVTRQRLWLQTMQDVLSKNRSVINTGSDNVIVQMPPAPLAPSSNQENAQDNSAPLPVSPAGDNGNGGNANPAPATAPPQSSSPPPSPLPTVKASSPGGAA